MWGATSCSFEPCSDGEAVSQTGLSKDAQECTSLTHPGRLTRSDLRYVVLSSLIEDFTRSRTPTTFLDTAKNMFVMVWIRILARRHCKFSIDATRVSTFALHQ